MKISCITDCPWSVYEFPDKIHVNADFCYHVLQTKTNNPVNDDVEARKLQPTARKTSRQTLQNTTTNPLSQTSGWSCEQHSTASSTLVSSLYTILAVKHWFLD